MKRICFSIMFLLPLWLNGQAKHTISGYVTDEKTGERLIGATVFNQETGKGAATNYYGFFSLTLSEGTRIIDFSFIGYKTIRETIELRCDTFLNIVLIMGVELGEIEINARRLSGNNTEISRLSRPGISMQMVESSPVILGERDILKTLQFLPGIKQGSENTASFNVRGGSADQNLILLDGVPVYNVNHLLGFFSVFNSDAIKNVDFIKGGIPARYSGRLSSVLDISMKEGNMKESHGVFSISPVSGRFTWEAPVKKDTAAYIVSYRRTFLDLPLRAFQKLNGQNGNYGYYFYDFNAKANWIINPQNRLFLSFYAGKDNQFSNSRENKVSKSAFRYNWGNATAVLRWNKVFSPRLFSNFSAYYSRFQHLQQGKAQDDKSNVLFKTTSDLEDTSVKVDFDFFAAPWHTVRLGSKLSNLRFNPNIIQVKNRDSDIVFNEEFRNSANETNIYVENAFDFDRLKMNIGGHLSGYFVNGVSYLDFQPRVSVSVKLFPRFSLNASFTAMSQHMHLLTNSSLGMPTDLWVASTEKIAPQKAEQLSFGGSYQAGTGLFFGLEGYCKWMDNVVRFDEGVAFLDPKESSWENNVLVGNGKAYGIEFLAQKELGSLTGLFSYTLSWSEQKFDELNNGEWFPFKYDRRHDVSILAEYKLNKSYNRIRSVSIGFTLQSGNNISMPDTETAGLPVPGGELVDYHYPWETVRYTCDHPNNIKMPTFHHLDIGYNIVKEKMKNRSITWSFSVYNVYNRMNPWYYYKSGESVRQVSLFPVVPSVGFKYVF